MDCPSRKHVHLTNTPSSSGLSSEIRSNTEGKAPQVPASRRTEWTLRSALFDGFTEDGTKNYLEIAGIAVMRHRNGGLRLRVEDE